jgi:hypothetical protein
MSAIAIAPARTARPASWPPMSRASIGTVAEASAACARGDTDGSPGPDPVLGLELGGTVGNRPAGLVGEVPVPGSGGNVVGGSVTVVVGLGLGVRTTM